VDYSLYCMLRTSELDDVRALVKGMGDYCILPLYSDRLPFPQFEHLTEIPAEFGEGKSFSRYSGTCYLWNRSGSPPPRIGRTKDGRDYMLLSSESEVIELRRYGTAELTTVTFRVSLEVTLPDGSARAWSQEALDVWQAVVAWIKARCKYIPGERMYASTAAVAVLVQRADPAEWVIKLAGKLGLPIPPQPPKRERKSYSASFQEVYKALGLSGKPCPDVKRRPTYRDQDLGPSFFRENILADQFHDLTLPGLYIGRCEVAEMSFVGSDLRLSTFNWNDFHECDFTECDLSRSDLRGCKFVDCKFVKTDLHGTDLRYSDHENCDFTGAKVRGAILHVSQRGEIALSEEQLSDVTWTEDPGDPDKDAS
jgi:hypothetical protein